MGMKLQRFRSLASAGAHCKTVVVANLWGEPPGCKQEFVLRPEARAKLLAYPCAFHLVCQVPRLARGPAPAGEPGHTEETLSTLRFASRVRTLTTDLALNESNDPALLLRRYERQIAELKAELAMRDTLRWGRGGLGGMCQ